jgi:hypothetical protein
MESMLFEAFVWGVTGVTVVRLADTSDSYTRLFLGMCVISQAVAIVGMRTQNAEYIAFGHVIVHTLYVDRIDPHYHGTGPDLALVAFLSAFTLVTRHVLGHCMFAKARGSTSTIDVEYDVLYAGPLLLSLYRLLV